MATLTSTQNWAGREVNGIILGEPVVQDDGTFAWDHPGVPGDVIDADGDIWVETPESEVLR